MMGAAGDDPGQHCATLPMNSAVAFGALSASTTSPRDDASGFEVDTYDRDGNPMLLIGHYDSIEAARIGIAAHAGADLDENTHVGSVLPSIVESWFFGPVEHIIHCAA